ncbi:MAG: ImmA/IrrE family metallo-endopeptidase [Betaproteobacteria bacterium]|nr:ImmA/IrrE family metallo-endopeptidase [Betaproteobacteria bacterium]
MIRIPATLDTALARVSVAHELSHVLIHTRESSLDLATIRMTSTPEEEAVAEYGARLLLLPRIPLGEVPESARSLAEYCVAVAGFARITVHSAVLRLADPDISERGIRAAVLWRLNPRVQEDAPVALRLSPQWFAARGVFVPIGKCHARQDSLVADLAAASDSPVAGSRIEDVSIGTLVGRFRVDAFAWGSLTAGTRLVLFVCKAGPEHRDHSLT